VPSSVPSKSRQPALHGEVVANAYLRRLERLCRLLGVSGGRLTQFFGGHSTTIAAAGKQLEDVRVLEAMALRWGAPLVVANHGLAIGFYAGIVLPTPPSAERMVLSLFDPLPRSAAMAQTIAAMASDLLSSAALKKQQSLIDQQAAEIAEFVVLEEQRRTLFDRASATAKMGVWQCELPSGRLSWTNGVYDIFELPHQAPITRDLITALYEPESRRAMEAARAKALAQCSDFSLDVEIVTAKGNKRWMRLTGAVESRDGAPSRIFGVKQDVTEERLLSDRTRYLAEFDVLTGLANRGQFQAHLDGLEQKNVGGLLLVDLDGFKQVNDSYGHAVGDACLKEAANRLRACCHDALLVARVGGDEFAVLTSAATSPQVVEAMAQGIVWTMSQPAHCLGQALSLGASVGVAHRQHESADDLFRHADAALYAAKDAGRNTSRTFSVAA
jgi:diguanylate cyclase (GGDEF)-like protein